MIPCWAIVARAQVGGSISGTVADSSGRVIPGAQVTVVNTALGTQATVTTGPQGSYAFPHLPVGRYDLTMALEGFKPLRRAGLTVDADSRLQIDGTLAVGERTETVTVSADLVGVDTVSTQMGEVVSGQTMLTLSLNGRSYTDLLAIQPGVVPRTTILSDAVIGSGFGGAISPSGQLNPGNLSISGHREIGNGFLVNGSDVQERMNGGTSIVPNLDSIEEFRVLTNSFDAQYGNYSGGIISVITKSGSDALHGDGFEFFRSSAFDARGYFDPTRAAFEQHQPGGTLGGPIRRHRLFFFVDYQGTATTQGVDTGLIPVPSVQERAGNLSDLTGSLTGTVSGPYWANVLSQRLGYPVSAGEPYYSPGCASASQCVLPNAVIPLAAWSAPAQHLLQYIPAPNSGANNFTTGAYDRTVRDNKAALRLDGNSPWGLISGYYSHDVYRLDNPYPTGQGGANVPGFDALTLGRAQLLALSDSTVFRNATNEFHFSFMRNANAIGTPRGGVGVSLASQGFVTGPGTAGIVPLAPQIEGVETVGFNSFKIGETTTGMTQDNSTFHWSDSVARVIGRHTVRVGGDFQYSQVNINPDADFNGTFAFSGSETGSDFADYLLGAPSSYTQASGGLFSLRNKYAGAYAQDTWRARHNLTLNYGLRWEFIEPWYEAGNQIQTIVPGQQSAVYPGAPSGLVFPGDPGIPATLSPARYGNLAPRLGLAYVPEAHRGPLHWIFGDDQQSSVRASYGIYYAGVQGLSAAAMYALPPFGYTYVSPAPPLFDQPFISAASGANNGQPFPQSPLTNINWSQFVPISGDPYFFHNNQVPYSDDYMVSFERRIAKSTILTLSYVGSRGHNLLVLQETNPGNPALCLSVSRPSQVAPGSPTCGPFGENGVYTTASGQVLNGTRGPLGPNYGSVTAQETIGVSRYNALELSLRHSVSRAHFLVSYTYGKSMDTSSNLGEQINPFNANQTLAPSAFDLRHNFVASYQYDLPFDRLFRHHGPLTDGWTLAGTTRLTSGFPVTLYNDTDSSLLGTFANGINYHLLDTPNLTPGPLNINTDPSKGPAFNTSLFSMPPLGQLGNAPRRFFYGPGTENFDLALIKNLRIAAHALQVRLEAFNVFNHPQFGVPGAVNGNIASPTFGQIVSAAPPREIQVGLKYMF